MRSKDIFCVKNLSLKEEGLEIHCGVSHNIHKDGRHVNCHKNSQQSSSKNNLKWRNKGAR